MLFSLVFIFTSIFAPYTVLECANRLNLLKLVRTLQSYHIKTFQIIVRRHFSIFYFVFFFLYVLYPGGVTKSKRHGRQKQQSHTVRPTNKRHVVFAAGMMTQLPADPPQECCKRMCLAHMCAMNVSTYRHDLQNQCDRHTRKASDSVCGLSFVRCISSVTAA